MSCNVRLVYVMSVYVWLGQVKSVISGWSV